MPRLKRRRASVYSKPKGGQSGLEYHCNYCGRELSNAVRLKCAQCPDFDLCVDCFSVGAEVQPHQNNHPYRVVEPMNFSVYAEDWTADDEQRMLDGISTYGIGASRDSERQHAKDSVRGTQ